MGDPGAVAAGGMLPTRQQNDAGASVAEDLPNSCRCCERPRDPGALRGALPGPAGTRRRRSPQTPGYVRPQHRTSRRHSRYPSDSGPARPSRAWPAPGRTQYGQVHRDRRDGPRVDTGLLGQLPQGCANQGCIGRLKMTTWPPARVRGILAGVSEKHARQVLQSSRVCGGFLWAYGGGQLVNVDSPECCAGWFDEITLHAL